MQVEKSLLEGTPLAGVALDYSKCFDRIPLKITFKLAEHLGMHVSIRRPLQAMYGQLRRRFQVAGSLGAEFAATNGILQGCPLSVVLVNMLMNVWTLAVKAEVGGAVPQSFADDANMTACSGAALQPAMRVTGDFARLTGQELNAKKSKCWSTFEEENTSGVKN